MSEREFDEYLRQLSDRLGRNVRREDVTGELRDHLEEQFDDLVASGVQKNAAIERVLAECGEPPRLADALTLVGRRGRRRRLVRWSGASTVAIACSLVLLWAMWPERARVPLARLIIAQAQPESAPEAAPAVVGSDDQEGQLEQVLAKPIYLEFQDTPLREVVSFLSDATDLSVEIDEHALEGMGVSSDTPVTLTVHGVPLRSALNRMLRGLELTWTYRDETLEITTQEQAETHLITRVYDVHDLLGALATMEIERQEANWLAAQLVEAIQQCSGTSTWSQEGGVGVATVKDGALIVTQTWRGQRDVADMLANIRRAAALSKQPAPSAKGGRTVGVTSVPEPSQLTTKIEGALLGRTQLEAVDVPLSEVCQQLSEQFGVDVVLDKWRLDANGISSDTPVTVTTRNATYRSILNRLTRRLELTWTVVDDAILITTSEGADELLSTRYYPIGDLVSGADDLGTLTAGLEAVISLVTQNLAQGSSGWTDEGGVGAALPVSAASTLAIRHRQEIHEQVERLLADLRALRGRGVKTKIVGSPPSLVLQVYHIQTMDGSEKIDMAELERLVTNLVEPMSWGGESEAYLQHVGNRLVVRQTPSVQRKVQYFLVRELRLMVGGQTGGGAYQGGMGGGGMGGMGMGGGGGGGMGGGGGGFF